MTKTDARPVTITYAYDQLNRNTTVEYSNTTNISPDIVRQYDYAVNGKGKFLRQYAYSYAYGPLTIEYEAADSYDAMGRLTQQGQSFYTNGTWSSTFTSSVTYDLAGNVTSQTYPSNRTVNYAYDAAGRTTSFTGNLGDGVSRNYATAMQYTAAGQLAKETFGTTTPLYQRFNYNVRQQLFAVRVGTNGSSAYDNNPQGGFSSQPTSWDRGFLLWHYGANDYTDWGWSGTNNNGNVLRAHQYIPCPWAGGGYCNVFFSDYEYDGLNRVTKVNDYGVQNSVQQYDYDRWGNRTINQTYTTTSPDINKKLFTVNTTNNRLGVPSGQSGTMSFDNVGNLISDTYTNPAAGGGMVYDAENHMTSAVNGSHKYNYNASGKRVRRSIVGQGEFWMVYGLGGELVAEYNANTAPSVPVKEFGYRGGQMLVMAEGSNPKWLIQDHLGSTRMEIALSGTWSAVTRHDYLPFGEELKGSLRTSTYGYGLTPNTKQKFTGYERDEETGLDFAQARYYASVQGRFTSPDPLLSSATVTDPQSWNRYSYVGNMPTTITDPEGLKWYRIWQGDHWFYQWWDWNPGGEWKEVVGTIIVRHRETGHLIQISANRKINTDLTEEAMKMAIIRRMDMARAEAERYVNTIILDFISTSVEGAAAILSGGESIAIKRVAKHVLKNYVEEYVIGKMKEWYPHDSWYGPIRPFNRQRDYGTTPMESDRRAIGGSPDHNPELSIRYYLGDEATGEPPGYTQTLEERKSSAKDRSRMSPAPAQHSQGGTVGKLGPKILERIRRRK